MKNLKNSNTAHTEYDYLKASSAQDCTGLIPRGIADDSEIENYEELYPFLPHAINTKKLRSDELSSEPESSAIFFDAERNE